MLDFDKFWHENQNFDLKTNFLENLKLKKQNYEQKWRKRINADDGILKSGIDIDGKTQRGASLASGGSGGGSSIYGSIAVIPPVGTLLQVTAVNAHGNSDSVFIDATSVVGLPPEMQTGAVANFEFTPILGVLISESSFTPFSSFVQFFST